MSTMPCRHILLATTLLLVASSPALAAGEPGSVGVAATTNATAAAPNVLGVPPQGERRIIEIGVNVIANERITTTSAGQAQFLLNDGTSFSVGPDSEVVLDKYVYDPDRGTGEMAMSVSKGVMRFVGGKISKAQPVEIRIGSATMGIRGGIAMVSAQPGQPVTARFLFGLAMTMTQNGVTQMTTRAGTAIDVPPGQPPSPPRPVSAQELRQSKGQMEGSSGGQSAGGSGDGAAGGSGGGSSGAQIEGQMEASGLSNANSGGNPPAGPSGNTGSAGNSAPSSTPPASDQAADSVTANAAPPPTLTTTTTLSAPRGRVVIQGGGAAPYNQSTAGEASRFTAVENRSASHAVGGLTTTTTAGITSVAINVAGNGGSVNTTLPLQAGTLAMGAGSFFAPTSATLNAQARTSPTLGIGLTGVRYTGYYNDNLNFFATAPVAFDPRFTQPFNALDIPTLGRDLGDSYSMRFLGYFRPQVSGVHTFATTSDDASFLWLGGEGESIAALEARRTLAGANGPVVGNGGIHPFRTETGTTAHLNAGSLYPLLVYFGENFIIDELTVRFAGPGGTLGSIGNGLYFGPETGPVPQTVTFNGAPMAGIAYRADNPADFLFYSMFGARPGGSGPNDLVRMTYYTGTPTPFAAFPTTGFAAHRGFGQFGFLSLPFMGEQLATSFSFAPAPILSRYDANLNPASFTANDARAVLLQSSLGIAGQGAAQASVFTGMTGVYMADGAGGVTVGGNARATARATATDRPVVFGSNVAAAETEEAGGSAIYGTNGNYMVFSPDRITLANGVTPTHVAGAIVYQSLATGAEGNEYALTGATAILPDAVVTGTARTTRTIQGYAGGLLETRAAGGVLSPSDGEIRGGPLGGATIATDAATNRLTASIGFTVGADAYALNYGALTGSQMNSAFVNDALFAATERPGTGVVSGQPATSTYGMMISHAVSPLPAAAFAPGGVGYCTCPFLQWGWWSAVMDNAAGANARVHLATWVAGTVPDLVDLPVVGTATYGGHAIGNVNNNGTRYVAMGTYTQAWNFATREGTATIGNFDGRTVNFATGGPVPGGRDFGMGIAAGSTAGITAAGLEGSFYRSPTDATAGVAGRFGINGTGNYQASGTFVAGKTATGPSGR
jgi:hypothetical protein